MTTKDDRSEFLARFGEAAGDVTTPEQAAAAYELAKGGARELGNSTNWEGACDWLIANYEETADDTRRKWVIRGGLEMLIAANE
ncbi:hypothetical protein ACFY1P_19600 [Streptomyces sp. NPDC001407]|uniref:hypothetical protein n=1 Tax=Streptomyces sp. NPDC001407 TaxID=3364573 RepID=UPI003698D2A2